MIHPDMMTKLTDFFPETCEIQSATVASSGETEPSGWTDKLTGLKGRISEWNPSRKGDVMRREDGTIIMHPWHVVLQTYQSTITEKDRLVIGSTNYDILSVHFDSEDEMTRLIVEIVK